MSYTPEEIDSMILDLDEVQQTLLQVQIDIHQSACALSDPLAKEYMQHGAGRRLLILRKALAAVFDAFPLTTSVPLPSENLDIVQVNLHAFVMNLYGYFENLAWSFVCRHGLAENLKKRQDIGLFAEKTQQFMPLVLKSYLAMPEIKQWHRDYLKGYRDALAHRIPLYVPPAVYTDSERTRYLEINEKIREYTRLHQFGAAEHLERKQELIGTPCFYFLHSFSDGNRPVFLHPQMLCDAKTVIEFSPLFLKHWHECVLPG